MAKFTITLTENYDIKTYKITEEMFMLLSFQLEPYRSYGAISKPVRCIENGKIFSSAMQAVKWLSEFGVECSCNNANKIKRICKEIGQTETVFGFHWNYVNDTDRKINKIKKGRPERWLYYAVLKNEVHSKSYKITEDLLNSLKQYLNLLFVNTN